MQQIRDINLNVSDERIRRNGRGMEHSDLHPSPVLYRFLDVLVPYGAISLGLVGCPSKIKIVEVNDAVRVEIFIGQPISPG
jgi:hypothetical protein